MRSTNMERRPSFSADIEGGISSHVSMSAMANQPSARSQKFCERPVTGSHQNCFFDES